MKKENFISQLGIHYKNLTQTTLPCHSVKINEMTGAGMEIPLPTEDEIKEANRKKEPTLFQKVGRSLMLRGRIALLGATLSAAAIACSDPESKDQNAVKTPNIANTPTAQQTIEIHPTLTPEVINDVDLKPEIAFQKLKDIASGEQNREVQETIAGFEQTYRGAKALVDASEAQQTEGMSTLVFQQREMFKNLDLKPLWESEYETEEEFLKSQIPFYRDENKMYQKLKEMYQNTNLTAEQIPLVLFDLETAIHRDIYKSINTKDNPEIISTQESESFPAIKGEVINLPHLTNVELKSDSEFGGGEFTPSPPTVKYGEAQLADSLRETLIHEIAGHGNDATYAVFKYNEDGSLEPRLIGNPDLIRYLSPEDFIRLNIARNELILNAREYDDYQKIFARSKDAAVLSNNFILDPQSSRGSFETEPIFSSLLEGNTLSSILRENSSTYPNLQDFLTSEAQNLDSIANENPLLKITIAKLRENPSLFGKTYGEHIPGNPVINRPAQTYYRDIKEQFSAGVLTSQLFENSPEINLELNVDQKTVVTQRLINQIYKANSELLAELAKDGLTNANSPASEYIQLIRELQTKS